MIPSSAADFEPLYDTSAAPQGKDFFEKLFIGSLLVLLAGYALFGRGFAYIAVYQRPPIFVGEVVFALGLISLAFRLRLLPRILFSMSGFVFALFFVLGLIRTIPYLPVWGIDALRDGVIYGYGIFMVMTSESCRTREDIVSVARIYRRFAWVYVLWVPVAFILVRFFSDRLPVLPGQNVTILTFKGGDAAVQIAGAVSWFLMVPRVHEDDTVSPESRGYIWHAISFLACLCALSRGALVSFAAAMSGVAFFAGPRRLKKVILSGAIATVFFIGMAPTLSFSGRELSWNGVVAMVESIFSESSGTLEGTKQWRLRWWSEIVDETVMGPYFWTGRGFGENLADVHGAQTHAKRVEMRLRSPHSSHMTILARMGVPGLLLWCLLHFAVALQFFRAWRVARDAGDTFIAGIMAWSLCFWFAALVNSSFDVYFEGPQGAIWFWCVMGFGLAVSLQTPLAASQRQDQPDPDLGDAAVSPP